MAPPKILNTAAQGAQARAAEKAATRPSPSGAPPVAPTGGLPAVATEVFPPGGPQPQPRTKHDGDGARAAPRPESLGTFLVAIAHKISGALLFAAGIGVGVWLTLAVQGVAFDKGGEMASRGVIVGAAIGDKPDDAAKEYLGRKNPGEK